MPQPGPEPGTILNESGVPTTPRQAATVLVVRGGADRLEVLLAQLRAKRLVLAGLTADNCVLFTANDAHLRGFEIVVASDCVASIKPADRARALKHMAAVDKASIRASAAVRWA